MSSDAAARRDPEPEAGSAVREVRRYWQERGELAKDDRERIDTSQRAQRVRFEAFLHAHDLRDASILDVGCGVGDFFAHLNRREVSCDYMGVDIAPSMVERCQNRFPGVGFEVADVLKWDPGRRFDYVVSFGIHNIRVAHAERLLERVTRRQFELSQRAAHVALLTDRYRGFAPHIQPWRAERVLSLALEITPYVRLQHDYLPNDFSVTLYREPLIDTRPEWVED